MMINDTVFFKISLISTGRRNHFFWSGQCTDVSYTHRVFRITNPKNKIAAIRLGSMIINNSPNRNTANAPCCFINFTDVIAEISFCNSSQIQRHPLLCQKNRLLFFVQFNFTIIYQRQGFFDFFFFRYTRMF